MNQKRELKQIRDLILTAGEKARRETHNEPEPNVTGSLTWPVDCKVGPGLEGAIACESRIGYVNGSKGWLIYRGYDIFDLAASSTFEETSYLLFYGHLPTCAELERFDAKLTKYRHTPRTIRRLYSFPLEEMSTMAGLRLGANLMRLAQTGLDKGRRPVSPGVRALIGSDEDSIPMETSPTGGKQAVYEFSQPAKTAPSSAPSPTLSSGIDEAACHHLIAGMGTICGAVARIRQSRLPLEPDPELSHAGNLLYVITGRRPDPVEERIMDVALVLHADHGMNASTFAALVVASTLADIYFAVGAGIGALSGPLHGGTNELVLGMLEEIEHPRHVKAWCRTALKEKRKILGFGHRVYKTYDPRARILGPLAKYLSRSHPEVRPLYRVAEALEKEVVRSLGAQKGIFPNVDFYSGLVYKALGVPSEMFTPLFAVSRVSGWTARVAEYLEHNRIFRPRAVYVGEFGKQYVPLDDRDA